MNTTLIQASYFMGGVMVLLMVLGLGTAAAMPAIDPWNKRFFTAFFSVLVLLMCSLLVDLLVFDQPAWITLERIVTFFEYLFAMTVMPMQTLYLLHCCGEDWRSSPLFRAVLALWAAFLIMLGIAQFTSCFYYFGPDNQFYRGEWHTLLMAAPVLGMILTLAGLICRRNRLSRKQFVAFLIFLLPLTVAMAIYMFIMFPLYTYIGLSICALSMFGIILTEEIEQHMRQQQKIARQQWEIAHQRANIMVLQMRPHFIHNTMTSIYYLCGQDPKKAQQVTLDFNTYLRKNFTALASDHTIPFSEELEHTRAYLAVEQAQFEDRIFIDYDTPHTVFRLPPLTLQPIVENAVKHGIDPDAEPLRIRIQTRGTDWGSEIIVEDNGPGFEPADDNEPHIALSNIQQRLKMMCDGALSIAPRVGGGTVVKVTIPQKNRN